MKRYTSAVTEKCSGNWCFASRKGEATICTDAKAPFVANIGFRSRFIKQHNLCCISIQGEQASADIISTCEF